MDSKVVRADFGSGLICPRAQTCCASPTQTPARLANSPGLKSFHCPRWRIKFSLERFFRSVANLFAYLAVEKFCRASSAGPRLSHSLLLEMGNQCRKTTLVAHFRGSTREFCAKPQYLRKSTLTNQILARTLFRSVAHQLASPAVGKFSRASSAGGRRHLQ